MIAVTILYPKTDDSTFDMDYYATKHMPMFAEAIGDACQSWGVIATHGNDYHCLAYAMVESMDAFGAAMKEKGGPVMADLPNFTTTQPVMVTGDVIV
jgi:uncharacterized protein (TIGR02118 family)